MEGIEFDDATFSRNEDFCNFILSRFSDSTNETHSHLCAVIGAMSQELKDQNIPSTPVAYFGATCSSLDRLLSEPDPPNHVVEALLTILSLVMARIPVAIVKKKRDFVSGIVLRVLRFTSVTDGAVVSGLKCVSYLLGNRDSVNWADVSQLYDILMSFVIDSRPKVRRQSHLCLRDSMVSFQGSSLLVSASEGITQKLEKLLLLAGGGDANASDGPKGAQQILYLLDALKEWLPLMSLKHTTSILKYFRTLMDLRQPLVTRRITDSLNLLCLSPTSEVSPEALLELLSSLALSVSTNETSGDGLTFTARLLDVGMNKVYYLNRQPCVIKLPVVFNALKDILGSEHEEAIRAATDSFKSLINTCVDVTLINQGVDQIRINASVEARRSGPTIIEKICSTIESLLDYHFAVVWDKALQVVSAMFLKLGECSSYLMRGTLKNLADMQKLPDEDFPYRKQLHECIGSAVVAMRPEAFLSILPLNLEDEDLSEVHVWLFPILKHYIVGAHLSFFTKTILNMIKQVKKKSRELEAQGRVLSSRTANGLVYSLWSLLPSFCNYPLDTAESFKYLEKALCDEIREEPSTRGIICSSLSILIQQNKKFAEDEKSIIEDSVKEQALVHYTHEIARSNLNTLRSSAPRLLSILCTVFEESESDDGFYLLTTIGEIASIADEKVVSKLFKTTMQKLLKVTQEASTKMTRRNSHSMELDDSSNDISPSILRAQLFDLAISLLPGLNAKEIDVLFLAVKPALQDGEGLIQKKAYKVLSVLLRDSEAFISSKFKELLPLMLELLHLCHFSAKHHRLDCLYFLIVHACKDNLEESWRGIVASFLTEIILALKETNKKTRNRAYDILVQIGHACGDEDRGGKRENLQQFFNMVAGGIAGDTPHMISAAVKALARLAYEFSDLVSAVYNLLPSTFILLKRKNREIIKANLGLLKVLVAKSQAEGLQVHLKSVVEALLNWQDNTKNHFKAKIKLLLEMLVKKCGLEAVKAVMPEEHMKLLTNIRKLKERKEKNLGAQSEDAKSYLSKGTISRQSRWNHTRIFSDSDDDETEIDAEDTDALTVRHGQKRPLSLIKSKGSIRSKPRANKNLPEHLFDQLEDEPLDLLDRQKTRLALRSSEYLKRKFRPDDELEVDAEGRLIITEEGELRKEKHFDPDSETKSEAGSRLSVKSTLRGEKRRKTSLESGWAYTGSEYGSKKAGGDVKRKDKLEPYAYWPLDRKMMSRRPKQREAAKRGMASVVKMTKKLEGKSASGMLSHMGVKRTSKKSKSKKKM